MAASGRTEDWAALDTEALAHGFPGVESYVAAHAAGYRPAGGPAGAEQVEAFARAADAAGLPLAAFVARSAPEADVLGGDEQVPGEEPWLGDGDHGSLRPVSDTRSLTIAADSQPAPVPTVRLETTLAQTAATVAVVGLDDGGRDPGTGDLADHDAEDHAFGAGAPDDAVDPGTADPAFGEGHPFTPVEVEARDPASGVSDAVDRSTPPPGTAAHPGTDLAGPAHETVVGSDLAPGHDIAVHTVPVDDGPGPDVPDVPDHDAPADGVAVHDDPVPDPEPAHDPGPVSHDGGESW